MTPKLRGVHGSLAKLRHALEEDADKLATRIETADTRRQNVFAASHGAVANVERDLREVEQFLNEMDKTNGGDPLDASVSPHPRSSEVAGR